MTRNSESPTGTARMIADHMRRVSSEGRMPLFHGTRAPDFEEFRVPPADEARHQDFRNCHLGVHVSSEIFVAYDYAVSKEGDGRVILVSAPQAPIGMVGDRDAYLQATTELVNAAAGGRDIRGIYADELGDDLTGAGIIFEPSSVRIEASIPSAALTAVLDDPEAEAILRLAIRSYGNWNGASWVSLDLVSDEPRP